MPDYLLQYQQLLTEATASSVSLNEFLRQELPYLWRDAYLAMTPRPTNIVIITHGSFDYVYDDYATLESTGAVQADDVTEARLVGALGVSQPNPANRRHDDARLRGWVGPTSKRFGDRWDKGHFIAHSIGGAVDGLEANVFQQLRTVNRGRYREMEKHCADHPGTFCFSRPLYRDASACPAQVEFGVLRPTGEWWIQVFENR